MGLLIKGQWESAKGSDENLDLFSAVQSSVCIEGEIIPEPGRYHLYTSLACPFGHRTVLMRNLKRLEKVVGISLVEAIRSDGAWSYKVIGDDRTNDTVNGCVEHSELFVKHLNSYDGFCPIPVLWDRYEAKLVAVGYQKIGKIFNFDFNDLSQEPELDFLPSTCRGEIQELSARVDRDLIDASYKYASVDCDEKKKEFLEKIVSTLDFFEGELEHRPYLLSHGKTAADWSLFTFLVRFEIAFKRSFEKFSSREFYYPNLHSYMCDLYQEKGVGASVLIQNIVNFYSSSFPALITEKLNGEEGVNFDYLSGGTSLF